LLFLVGAGEYELSKLLIVSSLKSTWRKLNDHTCSELVQVAASRPARCRCLPGYFS